MTVVQTTAGLVRGSASGGVHSFRGIPFAAPPIGPLRFAAAQPVEPWEGVKDALRPGPVAPQAFDPIDALLGSAESEGDEAAALHLTVHTPDPAGRRPVFVWIHGGSFTSGSSAWRIYDTENFARDGVVSVGFNYRLGALGFADLREHFDGVSANPALTDAVLALRWIRDNIERFGGDPDLVTIAGESAGAGMVSALIASPLARGLFRRVIPQSGINFRLQSPEESASIARNFLKLIGVPPGDRAALEAVPTERILEASEDRAGLLDGVRDLHLAWNMHQDSTTLPRNTYEAIAGGALSGVDMLIGTTADENKLRWLTLEPTGEDEGFGPVPGGIADRLPGVYRAAGRAETSWEISEAIVNDQSYLVPSTLAAQTAAALGGRVYMYLFTWRSPVLDGRIGACHALENAFVFDRLAESPGFHGQNPPQELADTIHGAWLAFCATGNPQVDGLPSWPRYDGDVPRVMELGDRCRVLEAPFARELEVWQGVPPETLGVG